MIRGCWTAIVSPFCENGSLDEEGLRKNLRFQQENEIDGITALGSTGESAALTPHEQERIVSICKEFDLPLMVSTGTNNTSTTIQKTKWAKEQGADYAILITPYCNKPPQEGIYRHFMSVADAVEIPIIIYNIKGRTGVNVETETLKRLAQHPNIIGVKEASGDLDQITDVIQIPNFRVLSGDDKMTFHIMTLGGHGVISVMSNLIPDLMGQLVREPTSELHYELLPFFKASMMETNPIPIKTMMKLCGMTAGECRLPLCEPQPKTFEHLKWLTETLTSRL